MIITKFESLVVDKFIKDGLIEFFIRYMDDTLVVAKVEFNSFDKSIQVTINRLEDGIIHFLDIKINCYKIELRYKTTHMGQYCNFSSQTPCKLKMDKRIT